MKNKIIDLFCGCGGLSLGFEQAGFKPVLAIDMWEDAINTYNYNRVDKVAICEDIHNYTDEELKKLNKNNDIVGVIGGPPCQGYSTVGTRDIADPRNQLYLEYYRVVKCIQPDFFVLENVKGLLTLSNGFFKNDIIQRFTALGYHVSYEIVNAAYYGVPQRRERVIFVGLKQGVFRFPKPNKTDILSAKDGIGDLPCLDSLPINEAVKTYRTDPQNAFQKEMRKGSTVVLNHDITVHSEQTKSIISMLPDGGKIKDLPSEYWNVRKYNKAFERMSSTKPSNTVDTGHRNYFHYSENRIPTVRENCRLQSFPDTFEVLGSRTSQYKQIGNAVPPMLAKAIAIEIKEQMSN